MKVLLLVGVMLLGVCGSAQAQAQDDGDWDSCALMVKTGFTPGLVRGIDEAKVEGMGMYPSKDLVDFFGERSEPAALHFQTFRSRQTTGATMFWGGLLMIMGGAIAAGENGVAVALGGLCVNITGAIVMGTAPDHLSRAVWDYNRSLAEAPPGPGD